MVIFLIQVVRITATVFSYLIIANILLSYILAPFHPVRKVIDQLVEPLLNPIRRIVPTIGMFDFSPIVLIILIQVIETILVNILAAFG